MAFSGGIFNTSRPPLENPEQHRRFIPPTADTKPLDIFSLKTNRCSVPALRYIRNGDYETMLMFVDGATSNNGEDSASVGFGVVFRAQGNIAGRLERPPAGSAQTSNRAEIRAVLCALQLRYWPGEGFHKIILASDSVYVVLGACERLSGWSRNGWKTNEGTPVKNRDLWEMLLTELNKWEGEGIQVQFWLIPKEWNTVADLLAKEGAEVHIPFIQQIAKLLILIAERGRTREIL